MRKKPLIISLILMLLLGVLSWLSVGREPLARLKEGEQVFAAVQLNKLRRIHMKSAASGSESDLLKVGGQWQVSSRYNLEADPSLLRQLFVSLEESRALQVVKHREEDLSFFQLDAQTAVTLELFEDGLEEPHRYRFGKEHSFNGKHSGRYVYMEKEKSLVLLGSHMSYVAGEPSVWLRKYLPYHEQIGAVLLVKDEKALWKAGRNHAGESFRLLYPEDSGKTAEQLTQMINYVMQMRFMDIVEPLNNFTPDPEISTVRLSLQTFSGRIFTIKFLARQDNKVRCQLMLRSPGNASLAKNYQSDDELRELFSEWHFTVPYLFLQQLLSQ
jgi:hypothetical protein